MAERFTLTSPDGKHKMRTNSNTERYNREAQGWKVRENKQAAPAEKSEPKPAAKKSAK